MTVVTPIWAWLPGQNEPIRAGDVLGGQGTRFVYRPGLKMTSNQVKDGLQRGDLESRSAACAAGIHAFTAVATLRTLGISAAC